MKLLIVVLLLRIFLLTGICHMLSVEVRKGERNNINNSSHISDSSTFFDNDKTEPATSSKSTGLQELLQKFDFGIIDTNRHTKESDGYIHGQLSTFLNSFLNSFLENQNQNDEVVRLLAKIEKTSNETDKKKEKQKEKKEEDIMINVKEKKIDDTEDILEEDDIYNWEGEWNDDDDDDNERDESDESDEKHFNDREKKNNNNRKSKFKFALQLKNGSKHIKKNIKKSINIFKELLSVQDKIAAASYYELGKIYFIGYKHYFIYKRDLNMSLYYLKKSANMKNPAAFHFLSFIYFFDFYQMEKGTNKEIKKEKEKTENGNISNDSNDSNDKDITEKERRDKYLKKSVEYEMMGALMNYTPSILTLAYKYLYSVNLKKDCNKAKTYYKYIAEQVMDSDYLHNPLSELDTLNKENVNLHNEINNMQNNEEELLEFLNDQVKGGDVMAMYDLGKKYKEDKNFKKAYEYIKEASNKNNYLASKELAIMYLYGLGIEKNIPQSISHFQKAAEAGDVEAQCYLGFIFYFIEGYRNLKLALKYLIKSAQHDYGEAYFFLAEIILDLSVKRNFIPEDVYKIVFKLYEYSADLGYVQAYYREAQFYEIGKGVEKSCINAAISYKFIAECSPWIRTVREGMNHYINKEYRSAFYSYALAAYEGYEVAQKNLIYIYKNHNMRHHIQLKKIVQILQLLYKQGNYKALYEMGEIYEKEKKNDVAIKLYKKGLSKGDLRSLIPISHHLEKIGEADRAFKYVSYFIKQRKREKDANVAKMEKLKYFVNISALYLQKYKLFFKKFLKRKKREKNINNAVDVTRDVKN